MSSSGAIPAYLDDKLQKERAYWEQKLANCTSTVSIPLDFERGALAARERASCELVLDPGVQQRLLHFCQYKHPLVLSVLLTALKICLHKYTNEEDIVVATTIHRQHQASTTLNNLLALRDEIQAGATIQAVMGAVKRTLSEAYDHHKYPFEAALALSQVPGDQTPLKVRTALLLDSINDPQLLAGLDLDLALIFSVQEEHVYGQVQYNSALFKRSSIATFAGYFALVMQQMLERPTMFVADIQLLTEAQRHAALVTFNETQRDYPTDMPIHRLIEQQAARTPDAVAVRCGSDQWRYAEVNTWANQLAGVLRESGIGPGKLVGIYLDHSVELVVALLAVLKAGAAYVPIEPLHPPGHIAAVLADACPALVLTNAALAVHLPPEMATPLLVDTVLSTRHNDSINLDSGAGADSLAYVLYTSGSTGKPKGVKIAHRSLVNYIWWAKATYVQDQPRAFALYSSLAFDLTVTSIYVPLVTGGTIVAYQGEQRDISNVVADNQVDVLKLTPSHLELIKEGANRASRISCLIVGGEALTTQLAQRASDSFGGTVRIYNEYGPTEATVGCMIHLFDPNSDVRAFVPIGRPIANTQIYLLDKTLNPVAENVVGDLYISGDGLAQGYLNQDELTSQRFVPNPFGPGRMYQTGDLARRLPEGILEFLGRVDEQIKFHGNRVELGDIRAALNQHPQVRDCVITVEQDSYGHDVMLAYYVSRQELDPAQLRDFLAERLFAEIIPNIFVHLRRLPLTLNGKVDRRGLPTLRDIKNRPQAMFVAPRTPVEVTLAQIWSDVLGVEQISIHSNFFELGGHSLIATQVVSRVRALLHVDLAVRSLFEAPTIKQLVELIEQQEPVADAAPIITAVPRDSDELDRLVTHIEQLSPEELEAFLQGTDTTEDLP